MVDYSESPLLHYLAAARAAQLQGRYQERDKYLKAAHEARPEAEFAIGVTQAEFQLAHPQTTESIATLTHFPTLQPITVERHCQFDVLDAAKFLRKPTNLGMFGF